MTCDVAPGSQGPRLGVARPGETRVFAELHDIYLEAIPARERKTREQLLRLLERPDYRFLVLGDEGALQGFSILFVPPGQPFFLVEYLAVHHCQRNRSLGGLLLELSFQEGFRDPGRDCCLLEVEAPCPGTGDWESQQRRQQFYRRHGCLRVEGLAYVLPLPGAEPPPAMDLLVRCADPRRVLSRSELEGWLDLVYSEVYGCPAGDSRIHEMLRHTSDPALLV